MNSSEGPIVINEGFSRYDTADYLNTEDDIAAYLEAAVDNGDPALVAEAQQTVARARARIANVAVTKRKQD